jgi:hypothetical protein
VAVLLALGTKRQTSAWLPPKGEDRGPRWQFFPANGGCPEGLEWGHMLFMNPRSRAAFRRFPEPDGGAKAMPPLWQYFWSEPKEGRRTSPSPHPKERHSRTADVLLNHAVGGDQACGEVRRSPRRNLPAKAMPPFNLPAKAMPPFRQYFARVRLKNWP